MFSKVNAQKKEKEKGIYFQQKKMKPLTFFICIYHYKLLSTIWLHYANIDGN